MPRRATTEHLYAVPSTNPGVYSPGAKIQSFRGYLIAIAIQRQGPGFWCFLVRFSAFEYDRKIFSPYRTTKSRFSSFRAFDLDTIFAEISIAVDVFLRLLQPARLEATIWALGKSPPRLLSTIIVIDRPAKTSRHYISFGFTFLSGASSLSNYINLPSNQTKCLFGAAILPGRRFIILYYLRPEERFLQ